MTVRVVVTLDSDKRRPLQAQARKEGTTTKCGSRWTTTGEDWARTPTGEDKARRPTGRTTRVLRTCTTDTR